MNREIKFRGRDMSGHWVYGLLTKKKIRNSNKLQYAIATEDCSMGNTIPVIESTIGEFTGFKDVDGKEIFEGDILEYPGKLKACVVVTDIREFVYRDIAYQFKVIGNIHDNPELLEVEK